MLQSIFTLPLPTTQFDVLKFKMIAVKQLLTRLVTRTPNYYQYTYITSVKDGIFVSPRETQVDGAFVPAIHFLFSENGKSKEALVTGKTVVAINGRKIFVDLTREIDPRDCAICNFASTFKRPMIDIGLEADLYIGIYQGYSYILYASGVYDFLSNGLQTAYA